MLSMNLRFPRPDRRFTPRMLGALLLCAGIVSIAAAQIPSTSSVPALSPSKGQAYPAKPIRLIVPFPPGGSNDIVARMIGAQLTERLGKPVVIDNRGGAGGIIGTEIAAKSHPDGHSLLLISVAYAYNTWLYKLTYDPVKSFAPVSMIGTGPNSLVVHPGVPGYEASNWWGVITPAGTPAPVVRKLSIEISAIVSSPETQKWFASKGAEAVNKTPDEFGKFIAAETAKWGRVVKEAGIRAE